MSAAPSGVPTHSLDADTTLSARSFDAAVYGCGAVIAAVDAVVTGAAPNAFCVVRPPGHHAGPFGAVPSDVRSRQGRNAHRPPLHRSRCLPHQNYPVRGDHTSNGFCLFNSVAVGAAYARAVYGRPRVVRSRGASCPAPPGTRVLTRGTGAGQGACSPSRAPFSAWQWCVDLGCTPCAHPRLCN